MARDPKQLRESYTRMLGKDLTDKLSDAQIGLISKYYNSLDANESSDISSRLMMGFNDTELHEMARDFISESQTEDEEEEVEDIPVGLDDLLEGIRNAMKNDEEKKSSAIIPIERVKNEDLVREDIDEVILRLLGLEDVFDLDYATYKTLLREKMMAGRMSDTKMSSEETELLTNEFKRVKAKTGRFKVVKKPVVDARISDIQERGADVDTEPSDRINFNKLLPGGVEDTPLLEGKKEEKKTEQKVQTISTGLKGFVAFLKPSLDKIEENLSSIVNNDEKALNLKKKQEKLLDREDAKDKKAGREKTLESPKERKTTGLGKKAFDAATKPVKGIFDSIMDFIKNIALGSALLNLINIIKDPGYVLNPIIRFVNSIIGFVNEAIEFCNGLLENIYKFTIDPLNAVIGGINSVDQFIVDTMNSIAKLVPGFDDDLFESNPIKEVEKPLIPTIPLIEELERTPEESGTQSDPINMESFMGGFAPPSPEQPNVAPTTEPVDSFFGGGEVNNVYTSPYSMYPQAVEPPAQVYNVNNFGYNQGGKISGSSGMTIKGMGPDTQLIAAQPGEIVMSKGAVNMYGADTLLSMNKMGGGTNKPSMGYPVMPMYGGGMISNVNIGNQLMDREVLLNSGIQPLEGFMGGGMVGVSGDAPYDVILPLDHVKPENMFKIPDTPGGNTFKNARMTGAAGRERDHQGKAAELIQRDLINRGLRVKIVTPEEHGNYEDYDKYLTNMASKGVRVVPLHFDAIRSAGGTGFLTRTRAGDKDDAAFAAPIQQVLSDFQAANPDLGNISSDTMENATINRASAAPAALVELGVMTDWEDKYGKNFTQTDKFKGLASSVASAIFEGGNFQPRTPQVPQSPKMSGVNINEEMQEHHKVYQQANNSLAVLSSQIKDLNSVRNQEGDLVQKVMVTGVGSYVRGTGFFGNRQDKYFTTSGESISLEQFNKLVMEKEKILKNSKINAASAYQKASVIENANPSQPQQTVIPSTSSPPTQVQPQSSVVPVDPADSTLTKFTSEADARAAGVSEYTNTIDGKSYKFNEDGTVVEIPTPTAANPNPTATTPRAITPTANIGPVADGASYAEMLQNNAVVQKQQQERRSLIPEGMSPRDFFFGGATGAGVGISSRPVIAPYERSEKSLIPAGMSPREFFFSGATGGSGDYIMPSSIKSNGSSISQKQSIKPVNPAPKPTIMAVPGSTNPQASGQTPVSSGTIANETAIVHFSPVNNMEPNIAVKSIYNLLD